MRCSKNQLVKISACKRLPEGTDILLKHGLFLCSLGAKKCAVIVI